MPKKIKLNFKGGAEAVGASKSKLPIFIGLGLFLCCCCIIVICIIVFASDSDESVSRILSAERQAEREAERELEWTLGPGKDCFYANTGIAGARKNVRNPDVKYSNVSIDECKDMCASDENCNCITHESSDNSCYLRSDCDFNHCLPNSDRVSYILTNKPNYLEGYDDTNWSSNSGANCFVGHGAEKAIRNTYNNLDHSKNILDHCKRTCFENPECNCITYHPSDNLCYMRKNCSISSCAQGTDYDTYTYTIE